MNAEKLKEFANSQGSGYLKFWKALSIMNTLKRMPQIMEDTNRLHSYIRNCLEMEGFSSAGIDAITIELFKHKDQLE